MAEHRPSPPPPLDPLEVELVALGRTLVVDPPALDLADRVLARIEEDAAAPRGRRCGAPVSAHPGAGRSSRPSPPLLVVVLVPPVRAAVLDLFRIGGVTVREVPSPTGGSPTTAPPTGRRGRALPRGGVGPRGVRRRRPAGARRSRRPSR